MVESEVSYLEILQGQRHVLSECKLDEDLIEGQVNDTRVEHSFSDELPNDTEDMCSFPGELSPLDCKSRSYEGNDTYCPLSLAMSAGLMGAGNKP